MVRVGGMQYTINPTHKIGKRISNMTLNGKPIDARKKYKVAGWAPVSEGATGTPIWDVVATYLRDIKTVKPRTLNLPKLVSMDKNSGLA